MAKRKASCDSMASNKLKYATQRKSTLAYRHYVDELKNGIHIELIGGVFAYSASTSGDMEEWMVPLNSAHRIGLLVV